MARHYGLDWLRIGAFALLILYHIGMVFVPWDFHVKLPGPWWTTLPMLAVNPWRLALLFIVSGYASRALLARSTGAGRFAWQRTVRLLVPLVFGMAVVVAPQPWAELVTKRGYPHDYAWFWTHDYFRFAKLGGLDMPTWNHLWFVAYLWVYTRARHRLDAAFARVFAGPVVLVLPLAWLVTVNLVLFPGGRETHALFGDWVAHAIYLPMFLFGFALARAERVLATIRRWWKPAAIVTFAAYVVVALVEIRLHALVYWPRGWGEAFSIARAVQGWSAIVALIGFADTHWNRDHPWRATLTEAVFPFYIVHQTVIVLVALWLIPLGLPFVAEGAILVAATVAGCWLFYLVGRRIAPLRPLIGLRRHLPRRAADPRPAIA
jgi:hypothetical protein